MGGYSDITNAKKASLPNTYTFQRVGQPNSTYTCVVNGPKSDKADCFKVTELNPLSYRDSVAYVPPEDIKEVKRQAFWNPIKNAINALIDLITPWNPPANK